MYQQSLNGPSRCERSPTLRGKFHDSWSDNHCIPRNTKPGKHASELPQVFGEFLVQHLGCSFRLVCLADCSPVIHEANALPAANAAWKTTAGLKSSIGRIAMRQSLNQKIWDAPRLAACLENSSESCAAQNRAGDQARSFMRSCGKICRDRKRRIG